MARNIFEIEAPDVVSETLFKSLLQQGYSTDILCVEDSFIRNQVWSGLWYVRVVSPDGKIERVLSTTRVKDKTAGFSIRSFKSANGLTSFIHGIGYQHIAIPFYAGAWRRLGTLVTTDEMGAETEDP